ncbi:MAG: lysophospholipid acyltransferase family protein, partial [Candidatus Rokuibacteriota bacterium]
IVPLAFGARPARRLATWDAFLVPLPFARAGLVFGPPIEIKRDADREGARRTVEQALADVSRAADGLAGA